MSNRDSNGAKDGRRVGQVVDGLLGLVLLSGLAATGYYFSGSIAYESTDAEPSQMVFIVGASLFIGGMILTDAVRRRRENTNGVKQVIDSE